MSFVVPVPTVEQVEEAIVKWDGWTEDDTIKDVSKALKKSKEAFGKNLCLTVV